MANIVVVAPHDDDAILGAGGAIVRHISRGDSVSVIICTTGHTSHQVVLGITENPSPVEVARKRREEIMKAMVYLGMGNLHFLDIPTREVSDRMEEAEMKLRKTFSTVKPDVVYFNAPDAHSDHKGVNAAVKTILRDTTVSEAYQFVIWSKKLAEGRPEMDPNEIPEVPGNVKVVTLSEKEKQLKRWAIFEMRSQISLWPYPDWQVQEKPILDMFFIRHFLSGGEVFVSYEIPRTKKVPLDDMGILQRALA